MGTMSGFFKHAVLVMALALGGPALAIDFGASAVGKSFPYKDLPGVTEPVPDYAKGSDPQADCTRELVTEDRIGRRWRGGDRPLSVYSCEQNGITIQSTEPPLTRDWYPGITPDR